ncbi:DUF4148 domain-containing protein [Paraburkholderia sp. 40]|uniref:DUF4148 domain-containing protein n=1 Tax=unclassified Paraburkholderia TaxID=2615204 RepID=UPI003D216065
MKLVTSFAVAALSLAFGASAFAQTSTSGLTRADVRAQLVQAEADGFLPMRKNDYPPSAAMVARNKELYAIQHSGDPASALTSTSTSASGSGSNVTSY